MIETMPIPSDPNKVNARLFLRLQRSLLAANGVDEATMAAAGLGTNGNDLDAVKEQNAIFKEALPLKWPKFMGTFKHEGGPRVLVAGMMVQPTGAIDLEDHSHLPPIDRLILAIGAQRDRPLENYIGITALAADGSEDQTALLEELLSTAIDPHFSDSEKIYLTLPPIDPAREVATSLGFEPAGTRTTKKYDIPYTLLVRNSQ
jgi:hypothetical protein